MRTKKIRGQNRRMRDIEKWRSENLEIRWDLIKRFNYHQTDIVVHPWCDISIINSEIPEPKRKTRQLMLNGLIDIYNSWKKQLDKSNQSYYLKIWLYEPRFSKSQVVCAVGERLNYYENLFIKPEPSNQFKTRDTLSLKEKLEGLNWTHCLDEYEFDSSDIDGSEEDKQWFKKTLKKPHRTTRIDDSTELYSFDQGVIWLGGDE